MISSTLARCASSSRRSRPNQIACSRKLARIFRLRPVMMLSSTVMPLNSAMFWNVRAMPCAAASCGSMSRRTFAAKRDRALLRVVHAVDHVEHRALAGAVGPDDGADLVLAHVEAHVGQRLHAAEGERDVVELQDAPRRCAPSAAAQTHAGAPRCSLRACCAQRRLAPRTSSRLRSARRPRSCRVRPSSNLHLGLDVLAVAARRRAHPPALRTSRR